ncbi:MAG: SpoIIE family protein phosphatase, partial [Betaproteobacteria bacterium]
AEGAARRTTVVDVAAGTTIVFFTDGLVERRGEVIDEGFDRLLRLIGPASADDLCTDIVAGMAVSAVDDDIAVVAIRITEESGSN